jgi:hypothetical protein
LIDVMADAWALAFPWKLAIGAIASTLVCLIGSPKRISPDASAAA